MKKWGVLFCIYLMSLLVCPAQTTQPPPSQPSTPSPTTSSTTQSSGSSGRTTRTIDRRDTRAADSAFEALRNLEIPKNVQRSYVTVVSEEIQPLYRKPSKKELKNLQPSQSILTKYEKFLQQPDTGIFKLSADSTCAMNAHVIVATESCLSNNIPGAGTAYSFRIKSHRMLHLSDLILDKNVIKSDGLLQQGLMVNLGNIELDQISGQTAGLKYLFDFKPAASKEDLLRIDEKISKGVQSDGFVYSYGFYVEDNATIALRSIAYRGKVVRSVSGVKYNEMDFDKRKDILVVFRIVEKDANGNLTIIWKEISQQDSPVIKIEENNK